MAGEASPSIKPLTDHDEEHEAAPLAETAGTTEHTESVEAVATVDEEAAADAATPESRTTGVSEAEAVQETTHTSPATKDDIEQAVEAEPEEAEAAADAEVLVEDEVTAQDTETLDETTHEPEAPAEPTEAVEAVDGEQPEADVETEEPAETEEPIDTDELAETEDTFETEPDDQHIDDENHDSASERDVEEPTAEEQDESFVVHSEADASFASDARSRPQSGLGDDGDDGDDIHHEASFAEDETEMDGTSRRTSSSSASSGIGDRRASMRTEALIQAAARAVVAKINSQDAACGDFDMLSVLSEPDGALDAHAAEAAAFEAAALEATLAEIAGDIVDDESEFEHELRHADEIEEQEHEQEAELEQETDDVFSDGSPRTSVGSFEHNSGASSNGLDDLHKMTVSHDAPSEAEPETDHEAVDDDENDNDDDDYTDHGSVSASYGGLHEIHSPRSSLAARARNPRISDVTGISRMSQYERHDGDDASFHDDDEYVPHAARGAQRPVFRTPSSVRAIQMSSPSPSVIFGVSPRSAARRRRVGTSTGEGVDEGHSLGSTQTYSSSRPGTASKQATPTRFKVFRRPEPAPLVLLHATIMPSRWAWSDVMREYDDMVSRAPAKKGRFADEHDEPADDEVPADLASFKPSAALKRLHGTWCQLQEYSLGADTVTERGVLLPHPQNDYEVLEERLLEALELPVRRRARILECGHYLGPADAGDDDEDYDEYDDEYDDEHDDKHEHEESDKRHWCTLCRSDIRYESLGAERVFRVKVYASNGLMTVGAWDACWREMERVDAEIEPIVADAALQRELNLLRSLQQQEAYRREEEQKALREEHQKALREEELRQAVVREEARQAEYDGRIEVTSPHPPQPTPEPVDYDDRRRAAEDRLREIYGSTSEAVPSPVPLSRTSDVSSMSHASRMSHGAHETHAMVPASETALATTSQGIRSMTPSTPHGMGLGLDMGLGGSPVSPNLEAYERREAWRRQWDGADHGADHGADRVAYEPGAPPPGYPPQHGYYAQHHRQPHAPYDGASLPELLVAAGKVFLRDRKHVAITVLSVVVILLATLRGRAGGDLAPPPQVNIHVGAHGQLAETVFAPTPAVASSVVEQVAASVRAETETVVDTTTVKVYETVTETETSTETAEAPVAETPGPVVDGEAVLDLLQSEAAEPADIEQATLTVSAEEPEPTAELVLEDPVVAETVESETVVPETEETEEKEMETEKEEKEKETEKEEKETETEKEEKETETEEMENEKETEKEETEMEETETEEKETEEKETEETETEEKKTETETDNLEVPFTEATADEHDEL